MQASVIICEKPSLLLLSAFRLITEDSVGLGTWSTESLIRFWANVAACQLEPPIPSPAGRCWLESSSFQFGDARSPPLVVPLLCEAALLTASSSGVPVLQGWDLDHRDAFQTLQSRQACMNSTALTGDLGIPGRRFGGHREVRPSLETSSPASLSLLLLTFSSRIP